MSDRNRPSETIGFISPTSSGSLGDQAMLDAATSHAAEALGLGSIVFPYSPRLRSGARVITGGHRPGKLWAGMRAIAGSRAVACIGADVIDGVYDPQGPLSRLRLLRLAHRMGRKARIMGSSWSETPAPQVTACIRAAPWLDILARDPLSQARMEAAFGRPVRLVADLAFLLRPEASSAAAREAVDWVRAKKAGGRTVLGVNISGTALQTTERKSVAATVGLVTRWLEADPARDVIVLPHDGRRGTAGDEAVCTEFFGALAPRFAGRLHRAGARLDSWEIKAVVADVDLALTGRMHLAIATLGQSGVPLSMVYQGKFEGLMRHFGLEAEGLTMAPDLPDSDPARALEMLEAATARAPDLRARIKRALPGVTELARANFEGLWG